MTLKQAVEANRRLRQIKIRAMNKVVYIGTIQNIPKMFLDKSVYMPLSSVGDTNRMYYAIAYIIYDSLTSSDKRIISEMIGG